jgi:hypothetical protein
MSDLPELLKAQLEIATGGGVPRMLVPLFRSAVYGRFRWEYQPNLLGRLVGLGEAQVNAVAPRNSLRVAPNGKALWFGGS